jgi:hypothetical protein
MYSFSVSMIQRWISEAQMMTNIRHAYNRDVLQTIGRQMGYHHAVVSRLVIKHTNQQCEGLAKIVTTGHCSIWLDGCHSQTVSYSNNPGCPIYVCQQEQLETVWNQRNLCQGVIKRPLFQTDINEHIWHGA